VVLFDEPAAGLSSRESLALGQRIASIPSRYGCAVLLIEHDMEVVRAACQEVTVLDFGSLILQGKTNDVLSSKAVIAAYLGEEVSA
jgi:branched-chain amino acid transport system permease protein